MISTVNFITSYPEFVYCARIYRPSFRENWVYKFGFCTTKIATYIFFTQLPGILHVSDVSDMARHLLLLIYYQLMGQTPYIQYIPNLKGMSINNKVCSFKKGEKENNKPSNILCWSGNTFNDLRFPLIPHIGQMPWSDMLTIKAPVVYMAR